MTVTINGTTGIAGTNGSAGTPAVQGEDTNTGIFFPAADTIAFAEGGAEVARFDSNGNLGIGTSTPSHRLSVYNNINGTPFTWGNATRNGYLYQDTSGVGISDSANTAFTNGLYLNTVVSYAALYTSNAERARIDASGNLLVGTTSDIYAATRFQAFGNASTDAVSAEKQNGSRTEGQHIFVNSAGSLSGYIRWSSSTTAYLTSSDYRLKENVAPMQNALDTVAQLNPVTYTWKADGSAGQGFIAHELQAVVPDCVTGEKDAVDETGNPQYQGVDTSFLVATLVAALQEQQALITAFETRLAALEAK